ncbi:hypothetical protein [Pedosphaera parvula]|uniref:DUF4136 domain-containing protein n=1 Tax=Pedosphaera parvula (strain Ellin514) TaxID=320771 RepID=B9XH52_PEDPL|nr:hypothetical protein [Pedosphaera parvula]EEF60687.1 hypothetical protein Cflav_PD3545 [Pedosphaera parvula Ellin514]
MHHNFAAHLKLQIITLILSLFAILPITADAQTNPSPPTATTPTWPPVDPVKVFGSQENLQTIRHPTSVVAYRIDPQSIYARERLKARKELGQRLTRQEEKKLHTLVDPKTEIAGYEILSGPVKLSTNTIQQLTTIWTNPKSFSRVMTQCEFSPGIALKYTHDKKDITLLICLHCTEVQTIVNNQPVGGAKLFPIENQIITLAKQIFPKDKEIQKLGQSSSR